MPLVHIVLFEFKPSVERSVIQDVRLPLTWTNEGQSRGPETMALVFLF